MILFFINFYNFLKKEYSNLERVFYWFGIILGCFLCGALILGCVSTGPEGVASIWLWIKMGLMIAKLGIGAILTFDHLRNFFNIIILRWLNFIGFIIFIPILIISVLSLRKSSILKTCAQIFGMFLIGAAIVAIFIWYDLLQEVIKEMILNIIDAIIGGG